MQSAFSVGGCACESAIWKGKAPTFRLPKGKQNSEKATKKVARPLCVLSW